MTEQYIEEFGKREDAVDFSEESELAVFPRDFPKAYHLAFGTVPSVKIAPIVGMAGIGKTILAKEIFNHPNITSFFECRLWVEVGRDAQPENIRRTILRHIDPSKDETPEEGDERSVRELLKARRYLIVLDDVWEVQLWKDLLNLFDQKRDHSGVLLTTRLQDVALGASENVIQMSFLNNEESWELLRDKVFDGKSCPHELEKAGKKIAEKCDGLPLTVITVADIISKADQIKTAEHWTEIAENRNSVFMDAYEQMYEVLYRSYDNLHLSHLKNCFLYMGVFPQKCEIPTSKLIKLWSVENFLKQDASQTSAERTEEYLEGLHSRSLVLTTQGSSSGGTKTCRLHSVFWYLCSIEASKTKFFAVLNTYADCMENDIGDHRRLSINNNVLFSIKEIHQTISSISDVHSLLCLGPYHQYEVPLCFHSTSITVIDALTIRFYEFPEEVEKLEKLKYLGLTFNGQLPPTISKLKILEFLIIRRHQRIKSRKVSRYLPMEVWEMESLKHLQVTGSSLPEPKGDARLPNLLSLLDVGVQCCTKSVLERIPNLEKLGIQIDLAPDVAQPSSSSNFDYHVSHLEKLKSLKCVIMNPVLIRQGLAVPPRLPDLPSGLKKLCLSGFGYPWEEMSKIASLPDLEVLKLRCFAFRGPKWEAHVEEFPALKYLLIEDTNLIEWSAASSSFYRIQSIILKSCYTLQDIPLKFWNNVFAELVDCNPSAAKYKVKHYIPHLHRKVQANYSW